MFAVDPVVVETFDKAPRSIHTLVRMAEDGQKTTLGVYKVHRWYEADMYGPEFLQFSEKVFFSL